MLESYLGSPIVTNILLFVIVIEVFLFFGLTFVKLESISETINNVEAKVVDALFEIKWVLNQKIYNLDDDDDFFNIS